MKVVVTCGSKLHSDKLAAECERHGVLSMLVTSFPKFTIDQRVPRNKLKTLVQYQAIWQVVRLTSPSMIASELVKGAFDRHVARLIGRLSADILVGWSGFSLASFKAAKERGMICVIERGSSHIATHRRLLEEEHARWDVPFDTEGWERAVERELLEYELADAICVPSQFVFDSFVQNGCLPEKLVHIPYGVDTTSFQPRNQWDASSAFKIVSVGMITLRKGQQYLLPAVRALKDRNPHRRIELHLIGPVFPDFKRILNRYLDVVTSYGRKSHHEVAMLLRTADAVVVPSIEEGLARVILEALASGIPTIITPNTGGLDIVEDGKNGLVVPIRDSEAIEEKLQLLLDMPDRARMIGVCARESVRGKYTWSHYGDVTVAAYGRLFQGRSQRNTSPVDSSFIGFTNGKNLGSH